MKDLLINLLINWICEWMKTVSNLLRAKNKNVHIQSFYSIYLFSNSMSDLGNTKWFPSSNDLFIT